MQDFIYKLIEDGTYCIMEYKGDEANVAIPNTYCGAPITVLYDNLFRGHSEITSLYIPNSVTDIGELVFAGCDNLRQIKLPSQLYFLWGMSFARSSFEEIIIPDRVTSLPPFAFSDCKRLKRVVCGSGMRKIHSWVFGGCNNLQELVMGQNVEVSPDAFKKKGKNLNTL